MARDYLSTGSTFENEVGYSRAVIDGRWIFVAGTTGYDYDNMTIPDDVESQTENAMQTIRKVLEEAGSSLADVVRVMYILPNREDFPKTWAILRRYWGENRPAATMISAQLQNEAMKIEIEVTARKAA